METILEKIKIRVKINAETGCWEWQKSKDKDGYGYYSCKGNINTRAHRMIFEYTYGAILGDLCCLHKCDNPSCCNPEHLWVGTNADNLKDMAEKGRSAKGLRHGTKTHPESVARGDRSGSKKHPERLARGDRSGARLHPEKIPRGEKHWCSKLTNEQVLEIRKKYVRRVYTYRKLAKEYGVCTDTINKVVKKIYWKHLVDKKDNNASLQ